MLAPLILSIFASLLCYYVVWAIWHTYYWQRRGIKGPSSLPVIGNMWEVTDPANAWYLRLSDYTKKFGQVWGYQEGVYNVLVVADLGAAYDVMHKRFDIFQARKDPSHFVAPDPDAPRVHLAEAVGARWKRLRHIVSPQFTKTAIQKVVPTVNDSASHMVKHMEKHCNRDPIEIHGFFQEFTMDVIARIAMGQKGSMQWKSDYIDILRPIFYHSRRRNIFLFSSAMPHLRKVMRFLISKVQKGLPTHALFAQVERAVMARKAERDAGTADDGTDFIKLFLDAEADYLDVTMENGNPNGQISRKLTIEEVIAQCFIFLLAGFDTTANALAYATHYIANMEGIQRQLQEEIDQVCTTKDISQRQLDDLTYMDCVIKEALRLHPFATVALSRVAQEDCEVAGVRVEKKTIVQVDAYSLQRSKDIWGADANEFIPERWMNLTKEQTQAFLTFGAGPRSCLGIRLAYTEEKMALAHVLRQFYLKPASSVQKELDVEGAFNVSPRAVDVCITSRSSN